MDEQLCIEFMGNKNKKGEYLNEVADMKEMADEVKQHLMDSNIFVKKGTEGIAVKMSNI